MLERPWTDDVGQTSVVSGIVYFVDLEHFV